jgi:hypothetical protein
MQEKSRRLNAPFFGLRVAPTLVLIALTPVGQSAAQDYYSPPEYESDEPTGEPQPDISPERVALILARRGYRLVGLFRGRGDYIVASGIDAHGWTEKFIIDPYDGVVVRSWRVEPDFRYDGSSEGTGESRNPVGRGNYGPDVGAPAMEQRGPAETIGRDAYGSQHAHAAKKPHEISDEIRSDRSRRRVARTVLEPFELPGAVDPFAPGPGMAPKTGRRSHLKSFEPLDVKPVSNPERKHVGHTVSPLAASRANNVKIAPAAAALNVRKSALRSTALSRSSETRSTTAPARGSNPETAATALPAKAVAPASPIHPALAPVAADSSEARTHDATRSNTLPRSIEKPRSNWITNEAAPKSNSDR